MIVLIMVMILPVACTVLVYSNVKSVPMQGETKMSAVVQWLRLKATCPAPPAAAAARSAPSAKRARRSQTVKQEPARPPKVDPWLSPAEQDWRQPQQEAQQAQHAPQQPQHEAQLAQHPPQQAQHRPQQAQQEAQHAQPAAQQAQHGDIAASILNTAPSVGGLYLQTTAPAGPASSALDLAAAPLVSAMSHGGKSAQQEHAYMDMLAQLRSNMFEDIAVFAPDELPTAGMAPVCCCPK